MTKVEEVDELCKKFPDQHIIERAMMIMLVMHSGQVDDGGFPYITHPLWLFARAKTEDEQVVLLLHDVIEDTSATREDLLRWGISEVQVEAIVCMSRITCVNGTKELYQSFIARIALNPLAKACKLLDLEHNTLPERILQMAVEKRDIVERYEKAKRFLLEGVWALYDIIAS